MAQFLPNILYCEYISNIIVSWLLLDNYSKLYLVFNDINDNASKTEEVGIKIPTEGDKDAFIHYSRGLSSTT